MTHGQFFLFAFLDNKYNLGIYQIFTKYISSVLVTSQSVVTSPYTSKDNDGLVNHQPS